MAISNEEQAREAALTEASRLQGLLEARLETLESGLKDTAVGLKAEISNLEESFSKFCAEEQVGLASNGGEKERFGDEMGCFLRCGFVLIWNYSIISYMIILMKKI